VEVAHGRHQPYVFAAALPRGDTLANFGDARDSLH
jgi:hypothetical protein